MPTVTLISRKHLFPILFGLVLIPAVALLAGIDLKIGISIAGLIGAVAFAFLCIIRPFTAFSILILLGLTVWVSNIQLVEGISVMVGVGGLFTTIWMLRLVAGNISFVAVKEFWFLLVLAITIAISTLINWGGPAGIGPVFTYIQLLLLTVLMVNFVMTPSHLYRIGYVFIISSVLMAGFILLDQWNLLPEPLIRIFNSGVYVSNRFEMFERSGGIFGDPNFSALQLTIALPFIIEYWLESSRILKLWLLIAGVGILIAFSYTVSIGGLVGITSILLIKALLVGKRDIFFTTIQIFLIGLVAWWLAIQVLPSYYLDRITINLQQFIVFLQTHDRNLFLQLGTYRGDTWSAAFKTFLQSPIIGHGPGNAIFLNPFNSVFRSYSPILSPHNFLLSIANDVGVIGLFCFVAMLIRAVYLSWPKYSVKSPIGNAIFIALCASILQGFGIDMQTQKLLWILIGMSFVYKRLSIKTLTSQNQK